MKLLLDEIVEHPDADHVLRTLEHFLREISLETVRSEDELIVYGLGPSFRTMNPKDKTTVRATSQSSATTLHTEANFLASALAGDTAQDEIVRSKIERAFQSVKTQLSYGAAPHQTAAEILPAAEPAAPSPAVESVPAIAKTTTPILAEAENISPAPVESAPDRAPASSLEAKPGPVAKANGETKVEATKISPMPVESVLDTTPASSLEAKTEPLEKPKPKVEAKPVLRLEPKPVPKAVEPVPSPARRPAPVPSGIVMEEVPLKKRRSAILLVLPLLILLLAAAFYLLQHRTSQGLLAAKAEEHMAAAPVEHKAVSPASAPAPSAPVAMPTDIKQWVQAWAATLSTGDVQTQLALYETPLDRYFLTPNVSREQLLKDKQAEIADRKGVWTLKAEDVVVQQQTPTHAVVVFIKHITVRLPSSTIREERLKAQLKLKMVDGEWKITSERTIA